MSLAMLRRKNGKELNKIVSLPISQIVANHSQPRKYFDEEGIEELSQSIVTSGLLQPITVRRIDNGIFELIAGERRMRAFLRLGREHIPAIVEEYSDEQSAVLALIENLQRRDLNFFEEAVAIARLMQEQGLTQQQISQRLGKAQSTVANKLRLLKYPPDAREKMLRAGLTERHARTLLMLPTDDCEPLEYVIRNNLNVEQTEKYVQTLLSEKTKPRSTRVIVIKDMRIFLNTINKAVKMMQSAGIGIETQKNETEEYVDLMLRIPKSSIYRRIAPEQESRPAQ